MNDVCDVILRLRRGEGIRSIHRAMRIHRTVIRELVELARKEGWLDPSRPPPDEATIDAAWRPEPSTSPEHPLEMHVAEIAVCLEEGCSMRVIHQRLQARYACDESTVRRFIHRRFPEFDRPASGSPGMARIPVAGDVMEVDFGYLGQARDPASGRIRKAWVFSGRLRFSRRVHREVVTDQQQGTFFACVRHALEFFGGVPQRVVPDNLKAAVVRASFEDPLINNAFQAMAVHYGFAVSPCDPEAPRQKGGVENDMKYIKRNFLPQFRVHQRQRNRQVWDLGELRQEMADWSQHVEQRTVAGVGKTVVALFAEEKACLRPLPTATWEEVLWEEHTVRRDWRIFVAHAFYSVPYALIGFCVQVAITRTAIRVYYRNQLMADHEPIEPGGFRCDPAHAPPGQEAILNASAQGLRAQAIAIGPATAQVIDQILERPGIDSLRPVRRLLGLAKTYGRDRLEAACQRAVQYGIPDPSRIHDILRQGLDRASASPDPDPATRGANTDSDPSQDHAPSAGQPFVFARSPADYLGLTINICIIITSQGVITWTTSPL